MSTRLECYSRTSYAFGLVSSLFVGVHPDRALHVIGDALNVGGAFEAVSVGHVAGETHQCGGVAQ